MQSTATSTVVSLGSVSHTDRAVLQVPSAAYGATTLQMVARHDQQGCARRGCENYDDTQMWWFDPVDSLLRLSTYTASLNHAVNGGQQLTGGGTGFLTPKTPTYQHHCLAHVLSTQNAGTVSGDAEVDIEIDMDGEAYGDVDINVQIDVNVATPSMSSVLSRH